MSGEVRIAITGKEEAIQRVMDFSSCGTVNDDGTIEASCSFDRGLHNALRYVLHYTYPNIDVRDSKSLSIYGGRIIDLKYF